MSLRNQSGALHLAPILAVVLVAGLVWLVLGLQHRREEQYAEIGVRLSRIEQTLARLELELTRMRVRALSEPPTKPAP